MNKYKIEFLLNEMPTGAISKFANRLKITPAGVRMFLNSKTATFNSMHKYTVAFNKEFGTKYSYNELFELIEDLELITK